jgi:DUF971 family protein
MEMARLRSLRRVGPETLLCIWEDGLEVYLLVAQLRDHCPCALCQGEQVFDRYILPVRVVSPGMYELLRLEPVGNYGLRAVWGDGHSTGIYSWELLRRLCEEHGQTQAPDENKAAQQ